MIYDEETKRWYLNEFHLQQCKAALASNERLRERRPLSHEEVVALVERWYAMNDNI